MRSSISSKREFPASDPASVPGAGGVTSGRLLIVDLHTSHTLSPCTQPSTLHYACKCMQGEKAPVIMGSCRLSATVTVQSSYRQLTDAASDDVSNCCSSVYNFVMYKAGGSMNAGRSTLTRDHFSAQVRCRKASSPRHWQSRDMASPHCKTVHTALNKHADPDVLWRG